MLAPPPPPPLFRPPIEGRVDLSSARKFLTSLCWLVKDQARWSSVPWVILFPFVAVVSKLSKYASKLSAKFAPWGRTRVSPWNGAGLVAGAMLWTIWAAAAAPNEYTPLAKHVSRSKFVCRGLNVSFQALHSWSAFGFLSHSRRLLGKELARRREDVAIAASQFSVIRRPACWDFFFASYIAMMNWVTRGSLVQ